MRSRCNRSPLQRTLRSPLQRTSAELRCGERCGARCSQRQTEPAADAPSRPDSGGDSCRAIGTSERRGSCGRCGFDDGASRRRAAADHDAGGAAEATEPAPGKGKKKSKSVAAQAGQRRSKRRFRPGNVVVDGSWACSSRSRASVCQRQTQRVPDRDARPRASQPSSPVFV